MKPIGYSFLIFSTFYIQAFSQSSKWLSIGNVSLSEQVSLKGYKSYLSSIQKDSTSVFYSSQLPDSTIGSTDQMKRYLSEKKYESFSAVGVSWESAMNYCFWLTKKEQPDSIRYYYRIPTIEEWKQFFQLDKRYFQSGFEDWLMNSYDESLPSSYIYYHKKSDPMVFKRKSILGSSFLRTIPIDQPLYYYAVHGYKNVGFRLVKVELTNQTQKEYNDLIQYLNQ